MRIRWDDFDRKYVLIGDEKYYAHQVETIRDRRFDDYPPGVMHILNYVPTLGIDEFIKYQDKDYFIHTEKILVEHQVIATIDELGHIKQYIDID
jgi:hypothetical protein